MKLEVEGKLVLEDYATLDPCWVRLCELDKNDWICLNLLDLNDTENSFHLGTHPLADRPSSSLVSHKDFNILVGTSENRGILIVPVIDRQLFLFRRRAEPEDASSKRGRDMLLRGSGGLGCASALAWHNVGSNPYRSIHHVKSVHYNNNKNKESEMLSSRNRSLKRRSRIGAFFVIVGAGCVYRFK